MSKREEFVDGSKHDSHARSSQLPRLLTKRGCGSLSRPDRIRVRIKRRQTWYVEVDLGGWKLNPVWGQGVKSWLRSWSNRACLAKTNWFGLNRTRMNPIERSDQSPCWRAWSGSHLLLQIDRLLNVEPMWGPPPLLFASCLLYRIHRPLGMRCTNRWNHIFRSPPSLPGCLFPRQHRAPLDLVCYYFYLPCRFTWKRVTRSINKPARHRAGNRKT